MCNSAAVTTALREVRLHVNKWYFIPTADGWEWHRIDERGKLARSSRTFRSRAECIDDAGSNGYSASRTKPMSSTTEDTSATPVHPDMR
jgi:hypothetical protein